MKGKVHSIRITPESGTHWKVAHEPKMEGKGGMAMPMGDSEDNSKLFAHSDRAAMHKHLDAVMDAHEGKQDSAKEEMAEKKSLPAGHPLNRLKSPRKDY